MGIVISIIILALLFFVMSIFLLRGKGSWLISGYNTASAKEKAKYNKKKLCEATGALTLTISFLLFIMSYLGYRVETGKMDENQLLTFAFIFIAVILIAIILTNIYINKNCKNK